MSAVKTVGGPESPIDIAEFVDWTVPAIFTWLGADSEEIKTIDNDSMDDKGQTELEF